MLCVWCLCVWCDVCYVCGVVYVMWCVWCDVWGVYGICVCAELCVCGMCDVMCAMCVVSVYVVFVMWCVGCVWCVCVWCVCGGLCGIYMCVCYVVCMCDVMCGMCGVCMCVWCVICCMGCVWCVCVCVMCVLGIVWYLYVCVLCGMYVWCDVWCDVWCVCGVVCVMWCVWCDMWGVYGICARSHCSLSGKDKIWTHLPKTKIPCFSVFSVLYPQAKKLFSIGESWISNCQFAIESPLNKPGAVRNHFSRGFNILLKLRKYNHWMKIWEYAFVWFFILFVNGKVMPIDVRNRARRYYGYLWRDSAKWELLKYADDTF